MYVLYSFCQSFLSNSYIYDTVELLNSKQLFSSTITRGIAGAVDNRARTNNCVFRRVFGEAIERDGKGARNSPALEYACARLQIASTTG